MGGLPPIPHLGWRLCSWAEPGAACWLLPSRTEPQGLFCRPLSPPCTQQEGRALCPRGCWREALLQPVAQQPLRDMPCPLCSCRRAGAGLKISSIRACHTCRTLRPTCAWRPSGSSVSPGPCAPSWGSLAPVPLLPQQRGAALGLPQPRPARPGPCLPLPALPTQGGLVAAWLSPTPLSFCWLLGSALLRARRGALGALLLAAGWAAGANGALCPGLITRRLRDQTTESQAHILSGEWGAWSVGNADRPSLQARALIWALLLLLTALQPLENDWDISVSSLAARTASVLRSPQVQHRPRGLEQALRSCWP